RPNVNLMISGDTPLFHLELGLAPLRVPQPLANADVRRLVFFPVCEAVAASQLAELLLECVELHARPDVGGSVAAHLLTVAGLSLGARAGARAARPEARAALRGGRDRGGAIRHALGACRERGRD